MQQKYTYAFNGLYNWVRGFIAMPVMIEDLILHIVHWPATRD